MQVPGSHYLLPLAHKPFLFDYQNQFKPKQTFSSPFPSPSPYPYPSLLLLPRLHPSIIESWGFRFASGFPSRKIRLPLFRMCVDWSSLLDVNGFFSRLAASSCVPYLLFRVVFIIYFNGSKSKKEEKKKKGKVLTPRDGLSGIGKLFSLK